MEAGEMKTSLPYCSEYYDDPKSTTICTVETGYKVNSAGKALYQSLKRKRLYSGITLSHSVILNF